MEGNGGSQTGAIFILSFCNPKGGGRIDSLKKTKVQ
jgi:hypothetical protein